MNIHPWILLSAALCLAPVIGGEKPVPLPAETNRVEELKPPCCRRELPPTPPTDKSLYQLESEWTSDVNRRIRLGVLQGRIQVLAMFFTHCEYACPLIVRDLKAIQASLPEDLRTRVDFVLVSLDPERDTANALHEYRRKNHLGNDHWTLLTARADDVRELAALIGINYRKDARGQFAHSNLITVLNTEGEIAFQQAGLNRPPEETVAAITQQGRKP